MSPFSKKIGEGTDRLSKSLSTELRQILDQQRLKLDEDTIESAFGLLDNAMKTILKGEQRSQKDEATSTVFEEKMVEGQTNAAKIDKEEKRPQGEVRQLLHMTKAALTALLQREKRKRNHENIAEITSAVEGKRKVVNAVEHPNGSSPTSPLVSRSDKAEPSLCERRSPSTENTAEWDWETEIRRKKDEEQRREEQKRSEAERQKAEDEAKRNEAKLGLRLSGVTKAKNKSMLCESREPSIASLSTVEEAAVPGWEWIQDKKLQKEREQERRRAIEEQKREMARKERQAGNFSQKEGDSKSAQKLPFDVCLEQNDRCCFYFSLSCPSFSFSSFFSSFFSFFFFFMFFFCFFFSSLS